MHPSLVNKAVLTCMLATLCPGLNLCHPVCLILTLFSSLITLTAFLLRLPRPLGALPLCFPHSFSTIATLLTLWFCCHAEILHVYFEGLSSFGLAAIQALNRDGGLVDELKPVSTG